MFEAPRIEDNLGVRCDQGQHSGPVVVIFHETQGTTLEGGANTLKTRIDGSGHEISGPRANGKLAVQRLAQADRILCHTGGQNTRTYGIEKVGISAWKVLFRLASRTERRSIALGAFRVARVLRQFDLPPRYLDTSTLKTGNHTNEFRGWTYHRNCSFAFGTTTHTDPGIPHVTWPHRRFATAVRFYWRFPNERDLDIKPRQMRRRLRKGHE